MAWTLDNTHTNVGFSVRHMMVSTVRGSFKSYRGTLELNADKFEDSRFEGEVDVQSIDTGVGDRDNHLRNNDFFDAPTHPKITFKSTRIERKGDEAFVVHGDLTIRGITKPVALDVEFPGVAKSPYGHLVAGVTATATISRKDFGLTWNAPLETGGLLIADKVKIEIEAEAVQK